MQKISVYTQNHFHWSPNVSFHPKRTFKYRRNHLYDRPLSVESRCGAVALGSVLSVAAPFVWRCPNNRTITPFPHPAHRTGHADFPHPALGQDTYLRTRKVMRSSPTQRTELCDSGVNQASVLFTTANATDWAVIRCPDRSPDSSFASACGACRSSRTLTEFPRVAPISRALPLSVPVLN